MKPLYLHIRSLILIAVMMCSCGANAQLKGVSTTAKYHSNPLDTIALWRNSDLYSGNSSNSGINFEVYNKWIKEPEKYYPIIHEAWLYCFDRCPEQLNLYLDGMDIYRHMIRNAKAMNDSVKYEKYYGLLMDLWDTRSDYVDSINANLRNKRLQSSSYTIRMNKVNDYYTYHIEGRGFSNDSVQSELYGQYRPIIEDLDVAINNGENVGGDINVTQLSNFFSSSVNAYIQDYNRIQHASSGANTEKDAVDRRNALVQAAQEKANSYLASTRAAIDAFNKNKTPENRAEYERRKHLSDSVRIWFAEYKDSLDAELSTLRYELGASKQETINARKQIVIDHFHLLQRIAKNHQDEMEDEESVAPFKQMVDYAQGLLEQYLQYYDAESSMAQLYAQFSPLFEEKKTDYAWLNDAVTKYSYALDFKHDDPFYQQLSDARMAARPKPKAEVRTSAAMDEKKAEALRYYKIASDAYNKARAGGRNLLYAIKAYWYYDRALKADANLSNARTYRSEARKALYANGNLFMLGYSRGQKVTVDGETFTVPN